MERETGFAEPNPPVEIKVPKGPRKRIALGLPPFEVGQRVIARPRLRMQFTGRRWPLPPFCDVPGPLVVAETYQNSDFGGGWGVRIEGDDRLYGWEWFVRYRGDREGGEHEASG
jgi:hypothetical protein